MDVNSEFGSLADEKFDFDISLSPASSNDDAPEDEVFGDKEASGGILSWSPLRGAQLDVMCHEAHQLATQLQRVKQADVSRDADLEEFAEGAQAKLEALARPPAVLNPLKRQTFCVQDSPAKHLPSVLCPHTLRTKVPANPAPPARPVLAPVRIVTQVGITRPQPRLLAKKQCPGLDRPGSGGVSKGPSSVSRKLRDTDTRRTCLQQPSRVGRRCSSSQRPGEDLPSEQTSSLRRRSLAPPAKTVSPTPSSSQSFLGHRFLLRGSNPTPGSAPKAKGHVPLTATPSGQSRACSQTLAASSPDVSRSLRPKRLISDNSAIRPPRVSSQTTTPSAGGNGMVQPRPFRPSALRTPLVRRTSAVSMATPSSLARPGGAPRSLLRNPSSSPAGSQRGGSTPPPLQEEEKPLSPTHIPPFRLKEEMGDGPPSLLPSTCPPSSAPDMLKQEEEEKEVHIKKEEVKSTEEATEVLLLGLPPPSLQPQEKLLIDLSNTPDLIRTEKTCTNIQLIDLSSPLIKWSPEDKKENQAGEAQLINLSF